jgi:sRNA-binding regulator protein Hfq
MSTQISPPLPELTDAQTPTAAGPRKLVRPHLPDSGVNRGVRKAVRRQPSQLLTHQESSLTSHPQNASQAEAFYFQKQMQAQTPMVFVLDDGEQIEGVIEWCDLHVIKVRHVTRTMIYKSSIKYLYKATELSPAAGS